MADKKAYTGFTRRVEIIPAYSIATIDYNDTKPNYFKIQNQGSGIIKCSTSNYPTDSLYDFAVPGGKSKMWAEPFNRNRLYVMNPTGNDIRSIIISFAAEFDPSTMALSDLEIDLSGTVLETSTDISSFKTPLPSGTNKIGSVDLASSLPAGNNKIGKVDVSNFPSDYAKASNQKDYTSDIASLVEKLTSLYNLKTNRYIETQSGTATSSGVTYSRSGSYYIRELAFFSNDGESNQTITFIDTNTTEHTITIKPGEVINHIRGNWNGFRIVGGGEYRIAYMLEMG